MRIVFLQNKGGNYGGVWQVNKIVGEALINRGHKVSVVSIRDDHFGLTLEHDKRLEVVTINEKDIWHTYYGKDFKESLADFHLIRLTKQVFHRLRNIKRLKNDKKKLTEYLDNFKPDFIVVSQYQVLDLVDEKYLPITFCEQHTSFSDTKNNLDNMEKFHYYNDKIKGFIWLTKKTMEEAVKEGLDNSYCIYNAVRFKSNKLADVNKNKKLVSISRISKQKRLDKMVEIVEEVFSDPKYSDWVLEIYGDGEESDIIKSLITSKQIKMMGRIDDPKEVLMKSSIDLNTSDYEGFPMTILEGYECGVPTVSLIFGEQIGEVIDDGKTGYIAKDNKDYVNKLKKLMDNPKLLEEMSHNSKEFNKRFQIEEIVKDWEKLFNSVNKQ